MTEVLDGPDGVIHRPQVTLLEFLRARIDEDQEIAVQAQTHPAEGPIETWGASDRVKPEDRGVYDASVRRTYRGDLLKHLPAIARVSDPQAARHMARFDPARVIAECDAKRKILELHANWPVRVERPPRFEPDDSQGIAENVARMTVRMTQQLAWLSDQEYRNRFGDEPPTAPILAEMARVYADHPDYAEAVR